MVRPFSIKRIILSLISIIQYNLIQMKISFTYVLCLFFILSIQFSDAQKLSRQEMITDIDYYFDILRNKHPNLYKKYTPMQFDSLQQRLTKQVVDSMDCKDFNRLLLRINGLTDGHTLILTNKIWGRTHEKDSLPYFLIKDSSLFLQNNLILSINKKDVRDVVQEISNMLSWEYSSLLKEEYINSNLPFFCSSFYDIHPPYLICLKNLETGVVKMDTVETKKILYTADYKQTFNFEFFEKDSIAIFHYNSCDIGADLKLFERALSAAFEIMDKEHVKYLFIDITKNGGGNSEYNKLIFKYLNVAKVKDGVSYHVNKSMAKSNAENMMKGWKEQISKEFFLKRWLLNYKVRRFKGAMLNYVETGVLKDKVVYPKNKKGFKGKVFLLQSRKTYSAAIDFAADFRRMKVGIVVGEKAGAPIDFCGNCENYILPNSGISVVCAMSEYKYDSPVTGMDENGILVPDIPYEVFNRKLSLEDYWEIIELNNCSR